MRLPSAMIERWPAGLATRLADLPIDHNMRAVSIRGGSHAGERTLATFLTRRLRDYADARNQPAIEGASGLSPYLHFGHVSIHDVFQRLATLEKWSSARLAKTSAGKRAGWWGMSASADAFLDQAVTWRELGFNASSKRADFDQYKSLPTWARETLDRHAADARTHTYDFAAFERAATHDSLWNAAQRQLAREGRVHGYLRMLWGKKILEWTRSPAEALEVMIQLNNKYALDGRDPNSYSGIFWVLGRYDRPWGPERAVFGKIRFMSSANTARKFDVKAYLARHAGPAHD